jgi:hypothetical protein
MGIEAGSILFVGVVASIAMIIVAVAWYRDRQALHGLQEQHHQASLRDIRSQEHNDCDALRVAMGDLSFNINQWKAVAEKSIEQTGKQWADCLAVWVRFSDKLDTLPTLAEGLEALCKSQVDKLDALNRAVEVLEKSIIPTGTEGYSEYSEEDIPDHVRDELEVKRLVRSGIPVDQARARIREASLYRGVARNR